MELDADKKRIILNMRCSDLKFSLAGQGWKNTLSERLRQYLRERGAALKMGSSQLEQQSIGRVREAKVGCFVCVCVCVCVFACVCLHARVYTITWIQYLSMYSRTHLTQTHSILNLH